RLLARRVDVLACGTWPTETPAGAETVHAGNPVRAAIRKLAGAPYIAPGEGPLRLLVIGGSQGAALFARTLPAALALLPPDILGRIELAQQVRPEDMARVTDAYTQIGIPAELRGFFEDVPERL